MSGPLGRQAGNPANHEAHEEQQYPFPPAPSRDPMFRAASSPSISDPMLFEPSPLSGGSPLFPEHRPRNAQEQYQQSASHAIATALADDREIECPSCLYPKWIVLDLAQTPGSNSTFENGVPCYDDDCFRCRVLWRVRMMMPDMIRHATAAEMRLATDRKENQWLQQFTSRCPDMEFMYVFHWIPQTSSNSSSDVELGKDVSVDTQAEQSIRNDSAVGPDILNPDIMDDIQCAPTPGHAEQDDTLTATQPLSREAFGPFPADLDLASATSTESPLEALPRGPGAPRPRKLSSPEADFERLVTPILGPGEQFLLPPSALQGQTVHSSLGSRAIRYNESVIDWMLSESGDTTQRSRKRLRVD